MGQRQKSFAEITHRCADYSFAPPVTKRWQKREAQRMIARSIASATKGGDHQPPHQKI